MTARAYPLTRQGVRNLDHGRNARRRADARPECQHNWQFAPDSSWSAYDSDGMYVGTLLICAFCGARRRER